MASDLGKVQYESTFHVFFVVLEPHCVRNYEIQVMFCFMILDFVVWLYRQSQKIHYICLPFAFVVSKLCWFMNCDTRLSVLHALDVINKGWLWVHSLYVVSQHMALEDLRTCLVLKARSFKLCFATWFERLWMTLSKCFMWP